MYWRVKNLGPEHLLRMYGVHVALALSLLMNVFLVVTRPNLSKMVTKEQKTNFDQFVRTVTNHILDFNYISYESSVASLVGSELAPPVVNALKQQEMLPKSNEDLKARAQTIAGQKQVSAVRIDLVNQSEPNAQSLIPIEVQGVIAIHSAEGSESPRPFRFNYLVGINAQTQQPIVAGFQELRAGGF